MRLKLEKSLFDLRGGILTIKKKTRRWYDGEDSRNEEDICVQIK